MNTTNNNNNEHENGGGAGKSAAAAPGGAQCRQSSTRWTPTTEQIRILKDLYYNYGIRSPSAEQIQRISAKLRQHGKIEGKNVFYWFQNHKARERQKKRFLTDPPLPLPAAAPPHSHLAFQPTCPNSISPAAGLSASASSSAAGLMAFGQMTNYGYNSVTMERKFRDISVSAVGGSSVAGGAPIGQHNYAWIAVDPYSTSRALFDKRVLYGENTEDHDEGEEEEDEDEELEEEEDGREMETLPLFPMHGDETVNGGYCGPSVGNGGDGWRNEVYMAGASRTSLELTLNSYSNWVTPASP